MPRGPQELTKKTEDNDKVDIESCVEEIDAHLDKIEYTGKMVSVPLKKRYNSRVQAAIRTLYKEVGWKDVHFRGHHTQGEYVDLSEVEVARPRGSQLDISL